MIGCVEGRLIEPRESSKINIEVDDHRKVNEYKMQHQHSKTFENIEENLGRLDSR
jgi:hypothetical protein